MEMFKGELKKKQPGYRELLDGVSHEYRMEGQAGPLEGCYSRSLI
jgi:hypothetical protein